MPFWNPPELECYSIRFVKTRKEKGNGKDNSTRICRTGSKLYDLVKIEITFRAKEKTSARAAQEVLNQCESFLKDLKRKGINPEDIHLEDDSVRNSYMAREEICITGARKIQLTIPFHMEFMNSVMEQIQTHQGNVDYNTEFCLSDPELIREQLLGRAVQDAKKKAEAVAAALGQKVIALKTAEPTINGKQE